MIFKSEKPPTLRSDLAIFTAVSLPFILITISLGVTRHFDRYRKMAQWVFPLWLYVAITGPICYLMLKPYY